MTSPPDVVVPARTRPATRLEPFLVLGGIPALWLTGLLVRVLAEGRLPRVVMSDASLGATVLVEVLLALVLVPWLGRRGWSPVAIAGSPAPIDALVGVGVWTGAMLCFWSVAVILNVLAPDVLTVAMADPITGSLSTATVVLVSLLNPVFEEFLWLGYAVPTLAPRVGLRAACAISVALRTAVHAYQGSVAIIGILPMGLFMTWYYARTRRLWPVVVAHVVWDAIGLSQFVR